MIRIVYFGTYDTEYSRNRILIRGFEQNNVEVLQCHFGLWKLVDRSSFSLRNLVKLVVFGLYGYLKLWRKYRKLGEHDLVVVGYPGFIDMLFARLIIRNKPIVFDAFLSLYDSMVIDRKKVEIGSFVARTLFSVEKTAFKNADSILLDTHEHIRYISELFKIPKNKFIRVPIGADDSVFKRVKKFGSLHKVVWWGTCIPLQGVQYILEAAKKLPGYQFTMIGGHTPGIERNVRWLPFISYENLPGIIAEHGIALGIFGDTQKTRRVIPNKVYEAWAMGMPLITAKTKALKEVALLSNPFMIEPANSDALVDAIKRLAADRKTADVLAEDGYQYSQEVTPKMIVQNLIGELE